MPHRHYEEQQAHVDDDYYHYYMASQKRVSRWISQTSKVLETATPMPMPFLEPDAETATVGTSSTLVASSSSRSQSQGQGPHLEDKMKKRVERSDEDVAKAEKKKTMTRRKSRMDVVVEDVRVPGESGKHRKVKRTTSMSPPPSMRKPGVDNALELEFGMKESVATRLTSDHVGSASDLARRRVKERRESPPPTAPRARGRTEESWTVLEKKYRADTRERREEAAAYRSRSRAMTSKRSSRSSSGPSDFSSTSFQALLVLLSSSMLMIAVAPKAGVCMSVAVAAAIVVVMNMGPEDPPSKRKRARSIDSTRMPNTMVDYR